MPTILSSSLLQAGRDYLASPETQEESYEIQTHGEALAINAAHDTELALRGNYQYVETREGVDLSFRVIHQPLGIPEQHVQSMRGNLNSWIGIEVYMADRDGRVANYTKNDTIPQIVQYRLTADTLRKVITDTAEADHIEKEVEAGRQYPLMSLANLKACEYYARYMGKRLPKNNAESRQFLAALPGDSNGEKLTNAGIPFLGCFDADSAKVVGEGLGAGWVASAPYKANFGALYFNRHYRDANDYLVTLYGSSPLLLEDIAPA